MVDLLYLDSLEKDTKNLCVPTTYLPSDGITYPKFSVWAKKIIFLLASGTWQHIFIRNKNGQKPFDGKTSNEFLTVFQCYPLLWFGENFFKKIQSWVSIRFLLIQCWHFWWFLRFWLTFQYAQYFMKILFFFFPIRKTKLLVKIYKRKCRTN